MAKLIYGVGLNDSKFPINVYEIINGRKILKWRCPYYERWRSMLRRCYSKKYLEKFPTYKDCYVCEEWLIFSNFKNWMKQQNWEGKHLDKDIIGNKKLYSPNTCCFIPSEINTAFNESNNSKNIFLIGVSFDKQTNKFQSHTSMGKRKVRLGRFDSEIEAFIAYKYWKESYIKFLAEKFKDDLDEKIYKKLINWEILYE